MAETFVVGSQDRIVGTVYDRQGSTLSPVDLTTATVALKASINDATAVSWACTKDPDQTTNTGRFTYDLASGDLSAAGKLELQLLVTVGTTVYKSKQYKYGIIPSL